MSEPYIPQGGKRIGGRRLLSWREAGTCLACVIGFLTYYHWSWLREQAMALEYPIDHVEVASVTMKYRTSRTRVFDAVFVVRAGVLECRTYGYNGGGLSEAENMLLRALAAKKRHDTIKVSVEDPARCWVEARWERFAGWVFVVWLCALAVIALANGWLIRREGYPRP